MSPQGARSLRLRDLPTHSLGQTIAAAHGQAGDSSLAFWASLLCAHLQQGRVYLNLGDPFSDLDVETEDTPALDPSPDWLERVDPCVAASGEKPVVRTGNNLWLARYYDLNTRLREIIDSRRMKESGPIDEGRLRADLTALFPRGPQPDAGQLLAVASLVDLRFGLLTGGPGTGKTTSLAKLLLLWLHQHHDAERASVRLLAPTGKAAARMKESLRSAVGRLRRDLAGNDGLTSLLNRLDPDSPECWVAPQTLHSALGVRGSRREGTGPFWHDGQNRLEASLVIVDEVSMVDLALMARLAEAVPDEAPLFLVGDADQLESVEAGFVLPDIIGGNVGTLSEDRQRRISARTEVPPQAWGGNRHVRGRDHVELAYVHRYGECPAIGELAQAVRAGDATRFFSALRQPGESVLWLELPEDGRGVPEGLREVLLGDGQYGELAALLRTDTTRDPAAAVRAFDRFRVLCAVRKGPDGVEAWNDRLQRWIVGAADGRTRSAMVTVNDSVTGLCNGDTGLILSDGSGVRFHAGDGRSVPVSLLPEVESAWAITIHKSQGSEYDAVAVILPRAGGERLLTRRLLYTALTRAKRKVVVVASPKSLSAALSAGGLRIASVCSS